MRSRAAGFSFVCARRYPVKSQLVFPVEIQTQSELSSSHPPVPPAMGGEQCSSPSSSRDFDLSAEHCLGYTHSPQIAASRGQDRPGDQH
jgi:hypothetical protein